MGGKRTLGGVLADVHLHVADGDPLALHPVEEPVILHVVRVGDHLIPAQDALEDLHCLRRREKTNKKRRQTCRAKWHKKET